ncbi:hypothetical protein [Sciscionella sediminilitoris]|uniref:hypothetical protein n=1 Tax=Sciscionella sediminilitoris TaxID=1445613 RepID=UPI0004DEFE46|nr:hypothetical protein [Sciscionella sp. SE31]
MYIDDGSDQHEGELKVDVDGQEYAAEANVDLDRDGVADAYLVQTDTGQTVYADTDGDGIADTYAELDQSGGVTATARFDDANHSWFSTGEQGAPSGPDAQAEANTGGSIHVDGPHGEVDAGKATIDSDHDGTPDTAVTDDGQGGQVLATDSNGDGNADVLTQIGADGQVTVSAHTGDGQWTVEEHGHLDGQGQYHKDSTDQSAKPAVDPASDSVWGNGQGARAEGVARIDATTGQWISRN